MLKQVIQQQHIENTKEQASNEAEKQFRLRAIEKYNDSLEFNEWMGDMFEAKAIAFHFWRQIPHEHNRLKEAARDVYIREVAKNQVEDVIAQILPKKIYYLAQETVKFACKNGMRW